MNVILSVINDPIKIPYYLGTSDMNLFWSSMFYGYIGVLIMILMELTSRNPKAAGSPEEFRWSYFFRDNVCRILLNVLLVFVAIRFLPEWFHQPMSQFMALAIGIMSDSLAAQVKKKKNQITLTYNNDNAPIGAIVKTDKNADAVVGDEVSTEQAVASVTTAQPQPT